MALASGPGWFGPASLPGRSLEVTGNRHPRKMVAHDRTRLIDPLRPFTSLLHRSPTSTARFKTETQFRDSITSLRHERWTQASGRGLEPQAWRSVSTVRPWQARRRSVICRRSFRFASRANALEARECLGFLAQLSPGDHVRINDVGLFALQGERLPQLQRPVIDLERCRIRRPAIPQIVIASLAPQVEQVIALAFVGEFDETLFRDLPRRPLRQPRTRHTPAQAAQGQQQPQPARPQSPCPQPNRAGARHNLPASQRETTPADRRAQGRTRQSAVR